MVYENNTNGIAQEASIAVVGVGGAGCNVVSDIYNALCSVDTIAINTDKEALHNTSADSKIYICKEVLKGEGARGDVTLGQKCADIHREEIRQAVSGYDFVFVIAGLGGGTGTGAASVVIEAAQSQGIMTFAIAIAPFSFEGSKVEKAKAGFAQISSICSQSTLVLNDRVFDKMKTLNFNLGMKEVNKSILKYIVESTHILESIYEDELDKPRNESSKKIPEAMFSLEQLMSA